MELESLGIRSLSKGINRSLSDFEIAPNECWLAENCFLDEDKIAKRLGYTKLNSVAIEADVDVITIYEFYKENTGDCYLLVQCGTSVYSMNKATGGKTVVLDGVLTAGSPLTYATINDVVYMSNGKDSVYKWDGSTATEVNAGDFPKARFIRVHADKLFFANIGADSASYPANPNMVYFSQTGVPETIDSDAHLVVYTTDGDTISAICSLFGYLTLFKNYSTHRLQGARKEELVLDGSLVNAHPDVGCTSQRSIAYAPGGVFFASSNGIQYYNGVAMAKMSDNVDFFINRGLKTYPSKFCGFWDGKHYRVAYPIRTSVTPNESLVLNPKFGCWTLFTYGMNDFCASRDGTVYAAGDDGFVYKVDKGLADDGASISMKVMTKVFDFEAPHTVKVLRKAIINVYKTEATLEFTTIVDRGSSAWTKSLVLSSGATVWGLYNWAITTGTVAVTNGSPNVAGTSVDWTLVLVGDHFKIDGDAATYEVHSVDAPAKTLVLTNSYAGTSGTGKGFCIWNDDTLIWTEPGLYAAPMSYPKSIKGRTVQFQFKEEGDSSMIEIYGLNIRFRALPGEK